MRLPRATLWLILALAALPARAEEPAEPGNAAIHYWCAAAAMKRPANDQEQKLLDYIEEWCHLPPKVFIERGEAVSFLKEDIKAGGAMDFLHVGAGCSQCDFDTDRLTGEVRDLNLDSFRKLARRSFAAAVVLEGEGHALRAAQLRADVLQFSAHLSQCPYFAYALNGDGLLSVSLPQMEAFLARKPGPIALRALMDRLDRIPPNPLSFSRCMSYAAKFEPALLKKVLLLSDKDLDQVLAATEEGQFQDCFGPAWENVWLMLRSKTPEERQGLLEGWTTQLGDELNAVARACDGPPYQSEPLIRAEVERMRRLCIPADAQDFSGNPFLTLWPEVVIHAYAVFAFENGRLEMARILCAAALFEARKGEYPASLNALSTYFPAGFPKDPFTGKDFLYALEEQLPTVTAQPTASLLEELSASDCRMSMALTLKIQASYLEHYRNEVQSPAPDAHN